MEKRTVKKIYHMDDYTLIRAIVIGIAYREKIKSRHDMLQRPTNKQLCQAVNKAVNACNLTKPAINDLPKLEKYFKYKLILLDEDYVESEIVLYNNKDANYKKNIYLQRRKNAFNVIDSMKSYCGKYHFCEKCIDIFSFAWDHDPCPLKIC